MSGSKKLIATETMVTDKTVRLSVEIPENLNEKLKLILPWGVKNELIRSLIELFVDSQVENHSYLATDIISGKCRIVVQNLNKTVNANE